MKALLRTCPHRDRIAGALLAAGAFAAGVAPSADGDIWWHLAAGREMVETRDWLASDPFSSGAEGRPWVDVHWLFQLVSYGVHQWLGLGGLVVLKCLLLALGASLLYAALPSARASWARGALVSVLFAALVAARSLLLVRPVIGTLVLMAFFFLQLERFNRDGRARHLMWLLPAQVVWANFQGLSALGPALVGAYALAAVSWAWCGRAAGWPFGPDGPRGVTEAQRSARLLVLATLGCCGGLWVTPFGVDGATLPAKLLARLLPGEQVVFARQVAENQSPFVLEGLTGGEMWHFKWALLALGVSVLIAGRRLRLSHACVLLGLGALAVVSNRNVLLLYWLGAPIFAINVGCAWRVVPRHFRSNARLAAGLLNTACVAGLFAFSIVAAHRETALSEPSPFRVPTASVERLTTLPSDGGRVFAADHYGGYLIWQLYPRFKPYIDTRLVLRSADEYAEYLRLADEPDRFEAFQARHRFDYVVLPVLFPDRYQRLIGHLYASSDWKLLFADGSEVLFGRADLVPSEPAVDAAQSEHLEQALAALGRQFPGHEKARAAGRLGLATFYAAVGQFQAAHSVLKDLNTFEARALDARVMFAEGDLEGAQNQAEALLRAEEDEVRSLNLLALIALQRGNSSRGLGFLRTALERHPFDPEANQLLAQLTRGE